MSIKDIGHVDFFNHSCIYIQDDMELLIVPSDAKDNILPLDSKYDYKLQFVDSLKQTGIASIKRGSAGLDNCIRLELDYIAKLVYSAFIDEFIMVGNEIDEFFSPLEHYFPLKHNDKYVPSDLLYGHETAASYQFVVENICINVSLVFGNVLSNGIRSDLTIHPQLIIRFEKSQDIDFAFRVSNIVKTFLQFVLRKRKLNLKALDLYNTTDEKKSYVGYLFSSMFNVDLHSNTRPDASFRCYGKKIENILSLISSDKSFPINHLNEEHHNPFYYTAERFGALCSAFEYEYGQSIDTYTKIGCEYDEIREKLISSLETVDIRDNIEKQFQKDAIEKIKSLGKQHGFKRKIITAYQTNESALNKSINNILSREKSIEKIARQLSDLRGKVLHNEMGYQFSEQEIEAIRFLEILQFVMTLRRAEYLDSEIEIIVGALYHCNILYLDLYKKSE